MEDGGQEGFAIHVRHAQTPLAHIFTYVLCIPTYVRTYLHTVK